MSNWELRLFEQNTDLHIFVIPQFNIMMVSIRGNIPITTAITTLTMPSVSPIITRANGANECWHTLEYGRGYHARVSHIQLECSTCRGDPSSCCYQENPVRGTTCHLGSLCAIRPCTDHDYIDYTQSSMW